jgi:CBS domain-containing protein
MMKVSAILATKGKRVITIGQEKSIKDAVSLLREHNIGALVVTDDAGGMLGILSERDIVRAAATVDNPLAQPVSQVMTTNVITCRPQDDLEAVANTMTEKRFRHLPVEDKDNLIGVISIGDVVFFFNDTATTEIYTLEMQIME